MFHYTTNCNNDVNSSIDDTFLNPTEAVDNTDTPNN